ncbi:hypothetical protein BC332_30034 [Capsicum chinense]|nr:hypothetical protein BC332_30034 [Capsicum chinense]
MRALQLFAADEGEASFVAPNIFLVNQPSLNEEEVGIGTDVESEEEDNNEPVLSDYDSEELEFFRKEKHREVNDQLDMFLELEKVDPDHAMEPPEIQKMIGRSMVKRTREKAESRKREGVWSASRKGLKMTCDHYGALGHNQRKCPLLNKSKESVQDVRVLAPRDSQESGVFMPTPGCVASSSQQTKSVGPELHVAPLSAAVVDTDGDESEEDEQPTM